MNGGGVFGLYRITKRPWHAGRTALRVLLTTALLNVLLPIGVAHAQRASEDTKLKTARAYVDDGLAAQNNGDYDAAILLYEKAHALMPHPVLLFNIAQAHRLAGRFDQAEIFYQRYLAASDAGPEAEIAREFLAEIAQRKADAAKQAEPPPRPVETPSPPQPQTPPSHDESSQQAAPWYRDHVGNTLVVSGLVATVAGIVVYGIARSNMDDAMAATSHDTALDLRSMAHRKRTISVVLGIAGGGVLAAGVVRYVIHDRTTDPALVSLTVTHSGAVVAYQGSF